MLKQNYLTYQTRSEKIHKIQIHVFVLFFSKTVFNSNSMRLRSNYENTSFLSSYQMEIYGDELNRLTRFRPQRRTHTFYMFYRVIDRFSPFRIYPELNPYRAPTIHSYSMRSVLPICASTFGTTTRSSSRCAFYIQYRNCFFYSVINSVSLGRPPNPRYVSTINSRD